jgi:multidrug efflux pump subunit AcrB
VLHWLPVPILLTSLTTFFGLMPLLFEQSAQALWLKPMAVTLAFGVMFATGITLLIVPAAYVALEEAIARGRRLLAARTSAPAAMR